MTSLGGNRLSSGGESETDVDESGRRSSFAEFVLEGAGEMGSLIQRFDWARTPLGPEEEWPQSLRTAVQIILTSRYPMFVWWGKDLTNLYNDPYRAFLGSKHPQALGKSAREVWAEIWNEIGPRTDAVLQDGKATFDQALLLLMDRHGYTEETYFTFSYSPLPDDTGSIGGLFCAVSEDTMHVIGERRLKVLRELSANMADCRTPQEVCKAAAQCLQSARRDLPFSLIYLLDQDGKNLRLECAAGIAEGHPAAPQVISAEDGWVWPLRSVIENDQTVLMEDLAARFESLPTGEWNTPPAHAVLMPIAHQGQQHPAGVLVAGLNPYRPFGEAFRGFVTVLSSQIAGAIANATAYESEKKRAEQLAEIDRAKTQFFSNVSHEFRTPLTLMLGTMDELLTADRDRDASETQECLIMARRNASRLLKLVNSLLDFSRIEAGRAQAVFEPTDLPSLTVSIASSFESLIERAAIRFSVQCDPIPEPVYVDRQMWEKVVLNLLSNAFKFTFEGSISVTLKARGKNAVLTVSDTGIGIPEDELDRVFERFHRIENARSRTYEGTGIGLALVQELVKLHHGKVHVESTPGKGSTFQVTIPLGKAHLPPERVRASRDVQSTAIHADAFMEEAERWLPGGSFPIDPVSASAFVSADAPAASPCRKLILLADDNADMRDYLSRLLSQTYEVICAGDGVQALQACRRLHPALVLSDVMMPHLDGFGLLQEIRKDHSLRDTPVILVSARAGDDARVEGLKAGAEDYLVKPFTAGELRARIATHIKIASLRREIEKERRLYDTILSNALDLAYVFDLQHRFVYANKALLGMWGKSWDDAIGKTCLELGYEPWHATRHDREIEQVIATRQPIRGEVPFTGTNGRRIYDYIFVPVLNLAGDVEAVVGTTRDITDRVQIENALKQSEERLRAFVRASSDVVYRMNADWSEMYQLLGKEFVEDTATPDRDWMKRYIHPEDQAIVQAAIEKAIAEKSIFEAEHRVLRIDGTFGWAISRAVPVMDADGRISEWFGTAADVTLRKNAEQALLRSEKLAAAGRLAATMAHEINNPLEALTNLIYLARTSDVPEAVNKCLAMAEEELIRVSHMTRRTLGFSGHSQAFGPVRVDHIAEAVLAAFAPRIRNKGIEARLEKKNAPPVQAIAEDIRQLISNLTANAIDAVAHGGRLRMRVSASRGWVGERRQGVRFTIADNGSGIPASIRERVFEPFVTGKPEIGTGLGLWISKAIVERHHGTVRIKTSIQSGRAGTAISVFFPDPSAEAPDQSEEPMDQREAIVP